MASTESVHSSIDQHEQDKRYCWVCFASEDDDKDATWVRPCRCKGTTQWVHQNCLQRWIDEKQKGNSSTKVSCPQCNTEYIIIFPPLDSVVYIMDVVDRMIYRVCPFVAAGIVVGSLYWTAATYGAVTVILVLGHPEGLRLMEQTDMFFLLLSLPTIPILLILGRMVRWEDYLLRLWRRHSAHFPLFKYFAPWRHINMPERVPVDHAPFSDPVSATRVLCGALMLPTFATICGKILFSNVPSNLQRTILGGVAFIAIKGMVKIYYKHQQYIRQAHREIIDFEETLSESSSDFSSSHSS